MRIEDLPRLTDEEIAALDDCAAIEGVPVGKPRRFPRLAALFASWRRRRLERAERYLRHASALAPTTLACMTSSCARRSRTSLG